jgi:ERCC4-type nuclease
MITIDRRKGSGELLHLFPKGTAQIGDLPFADFAWVCKGPEGMPLAVGVERKQIHDLVNSMTDGRLQDVQLPGLANSYQVIYLLVEGIWRPSPKDDIIEIFKGRKWCYLCHGQRRYTAKEVEGFINTLDIITGVHIRRSGTKEETASLVNVLHRWWTNKNFEEHRGHLALSNKVTTPLLKRVGLVQKIASQLPGIGWERSGEVAKRFKTPIEMVLADRKDWEGIDGIGKGIAEKVTKSLQEGD